MLYPEITKALLEVSGRIKGWESCKIAYVIRKLGVHLSWLFSVETKYILCVNYCAWVRDIET